MGVTQGEHPEFSERQAEVTYPILSANTLDASGQPLFQSGGKPYLVLDVNGVKIGVFALAGPDFDRLVKPALRPAAGATFADWTQSARQIVQAVREQEQVSAIVMIGHALYEDDVALAQAVPGIDLIFGTHSHAEGLTTLKILATRPHSPCPPPHLLREVLSEWGRGKQPPRSDGGD
jgi:2',3'-cyclic-nucleotide 2'-phosphodiesterase (5'-nucleotidase family)